MVPLPTQRRASERRNRRRAIDLLLHGHKYAIDAVVATTALQAAKPIAIATSDADDMRKLCGKLVCIVLV